MLTSSIDGTARIWSPARRHRIAELHHASGAFHVHFDQSKQHCLTTGRDGAARVWSATGKALVSELNHERKWVLEAASSPNGRFVATRTTNRVLLDRPLQGGRSGSEIVALWNGVTGEKLAELNHGDRVRELQFSPDSRFLLTCGGDHSRRDLIVRSRANRLVKQLRQAGSSSEEGSRQTTDIEHFDEFEDSPEQLAPPPARPSGAECKIWDLETFKLCRRLVHDKLVNSAQYSRDGGRILTGSSDGTATLWDATGGEVLARFAHDRWVSKVLFSADERRVVVSGADWVKVWDLSCLDKGVEVLSGSNIETLAVSPRDDLIAVSSGCLGDLSLISIVSGIRLDLLDGPSLSFDVLAFSPEGSQIAAASSDHVVRVWDVRTGQIQSRLAHQSTVRHLSYSRDGRMLAVACDGDPVSLWYLPRAAAHRTEPIDFLAASLAFGKGGKTLSDFEDLFMKDAPLDLYEALLELIPGRREIVEAIASELAMELDERAFESPFKSKST